MKLDIWFMRHGESEMNKSPHIIQGRSEHVKLSEKGFVQAEKLGERLLKEGVKFDAVYSSPLIRAYDTARIACERLGIPKETIVRLEGLVEQSHGDWEGKLRDEVYTPEVRKQLQKDAYNFYPPNGESMKMVEERMYSFVRLYLFPLQSLLFETEIVKKAEKVLEHKLMQKTKLGRFIAETYDFAKNQVMNTQKENSTIAVFSHAMAIKCLARKIMGFSPEMAYRFRMSNTGISRLEYTEKGWFPVSLNDAGHLVGMEQAEFTPLA
ncbi:MAG: histidine phosphatase family protein [Candidatus Nanoarchaeia archaeon]|nr:histidine phosphatase family protein [Candidatus Nanoarchaeia archaeon]